jgi:hypothetical protein
MKGRREPILTQAYVPHSTPNEITQAMKLGL